MAKVFGPALSLAAKGKIGKGVAFQKRPSGFAMMKNPAPGRHSLDNPSASQQIQRNAIASLINQWQALNENQRGYWDNVAKELGNNLAGYHEFMKAKGVATMPLSRLLDYWPDLKRGLVGYWAMDGDGENAAKDYSDEGNDGILKPSYPANCPVQVGSKNQVLDKALDFNGVEKYVNLGNPEVLKLTDNFSISFWFNSVDITADERTIIDKGFNKFITLGHQSSKLFFGHPSTYASFLGNITLLNSNTWYNYIVTWDGTSIRLYLNGILDKIADITMSTNQTVAWTIGKNSYGGDYESKVDDVRIYNRALSVSELKQLYDISR